MSDLDRYFQQDKEFAYNCATQNTKYNDNGQAVIGKDDEWRNEKEWDALYEELKP